MTRTLVESEITVAALQTTSGAVSIPLPRDGKIIYIQLRAVSGTTTNMGFSIKVENDYNVYASALSAVTLKTSYESSGDNAPFIRKPSESAYITINQDSSASATIWTLRIVVEE